MPQAILLYTPTEILAAGLASSLSPEFRLLDTVPVIADLPAAVARSAPALVLVDHTPDITYQVLSELRDHAPPVVLWASGVTTEMASQAVALGIRGILRKSASPDLLNRCLRDVLAGQLWYEKSLTDAMLTAKRVPLTAREADLCAAVARGMKNKEIAFELGISEGTVKVYLSKLFPKCGVKDRLELALFALRNLGEGSIEEPRQGARRLRNLVVDRAA